MPNQNTLVGPFGPPASSGDYDERHPAAVRARAAHRAIYSDDEREREFEYAGTSKTGRLVPFVVAGIGALVILGGGLLYAAGVIGAPLLAPGPAPLSIDKADWQPSPEYSRALVVQAEQRLGGGRATAQGSSAQTPNARPPASSGSLIPKTKPRQPSGMTVTPPTTTGNSSSDIDLGLDDPDAQRANPRQRGNEVAPSVEDQQMREQGDQVGNPEGTEDLPKPADPNRAPPEGVGNTTNPY